jgi:thioredoxin reductase
MDEAYGEHRVQRSRDRRRRARRLSAALVLGRARRDVLLVDSGRPANAVAEQIGGMLGHDGSQAELRARAHRQLAELPSVQVAEAEVLDARAHDECVEVTVACPLGVTPFRTRALLLANGLRYEPPAIPGIGPLWGRSVFHCPFCDGWEMAGRAIALHGRGHGATRLALLLRAWSEDLLLCTDGPDGLTVDERDELDAAGVRVREEPIAELISRSPGRLGAIAFESGPAECRDAMFTRPWRSQPSELHRRLGLELDNTNLIPVDPGGRTSVPRVYVAGDASAPVRSVAIAVGSGSRVGISTVADLVVDRLAQPVRR